MRVSALSAFLLLVSIPAHSAGPRLSELRPRGAQRELFCLTLVGTGLSEEAQVLTNLPGTNRKRPNKPNLAEPSEIKAL